MSDIKVSVIIPVYNVENYLERAVDSVLNQTLSDIEIILVDDGSPDQSPQICDNYARMYPGRIKVIHNQNEGLGFARNSGLKLALSLICTRACIIPRYWAAVTLLCAMSTLSMWERA